MDAHAAAQLRAEAELGGVAEPRVPDPEIRGVEDVEEPRGGEARPLLLRPGPPRAAAAVDGAAAGDGGVADAVAAEERAVADPRLVGRGERVLLVGRRRPPGEVAVRLGRVVGAVEG